MKRFKIKIDDRHFVVKAESEVKAVNKLKDAQARKVNDAHTRVKVGCAEITVNNEAKAYSVGSVTYINGNDERAFRDYAKQCIDVANKLKELESKGYRDDPMKAYDSAIKDSDDYSYEVIKEQINNEGFSKDLLLKKAYNGLTRGSMNKDEYKRLVEEIKSVKDKKFCPSMNDETEEEKERKAQEWVDYDIKHYGKVSEQTKEDIKKMGLDFDKWDNQVEDSAIEDAVALKKGDWFAFRKDRRNLYKLIDDKAQSRNGFAESLLAEHYVIDYDYATLSASDLKMKKEGTTTLRPDRLDEIIVFNSADEALKWFKMQLKVLNGIHKRR